MAASEMTTAEPIFSLNKEFLRRHPVEAARALESMSIDDAVEMLAGQQVGVIAGVLEKTGPGTAEGLFRKLPAETLAGLLQILSIRTCISILGRFSEEEVEPLLVAVPESLRKELLSLLDFPQDSAGRLMNPRVAVVNESINVGDLLQQMRQEHLPRSKVVYLVNNELQLQAQLRSFDLLFADSEQAVSSLARPVTHYLLDMDPREEVLQKMEASRADSLPVLNADFQVVGVFESLGVIEVLKEDIGLDMQTMVGASKEERALSSSLFAVRKRLPWLQINLVTAFMAASVVGFFEDTIAQFTALAVLMPIAAGQSGNTGAQALAVTMRGLTLREISIRDWFRVMRKEFASGLINGIGVAVVCALGVYLWSQSAGLALVMALAMVISMTIAGLSGALVPMILKRFGLDPAQSSSIVLTTVTDIAGFVSFLGIATLLSSTL